MNTDLFGTTKSRILRYLLEKRRTAKELADLLQIQVSAARKHLEDLRGLNMVSEVFSKQGLGRPKKFYALTDEGKEMFPRQYDAILAALLNRVVQETDRSFGEKIAKGIASDLVEELELKGDSSKIHMQAIVAAMSKFGFVASLRERGGNYEITSRNCPFYKAALAHPKLFCEDLHTEMMRQATGSEVNLSECAVMGGSECRHVIKKANI